MQWPMLVWAQDLSPWSEFQIKTCCILRSRSCPCLKPSHLSEFYPKRVLIQGTLDLTNQRLDSGVLTFKSFILWNAKIEFQGLSRDCQHTFEWYCNQLKNKFLTILLFLLLWIKNLSDCFYSDGQGIPLCTLFNICWTEAAICY